MPLPTQKVTTKDCTNISPPHGQDSLTQAHQQTPSARKACLTSGSNGDEHQITWPPARPRTVLETAKPLLNRGSRAQAAFIIFDVFVSKFAGIRVYSGFQLFCWSTQQELRPAGVVSGYEFFLLTGLATGSPLQTVCGRWCQISAMFPLFL